MKKKEKYYGVAGVNGCGVYNDYEKVLEVQRYVAKIQCKKFSDFGDAKFWAENTYDELQDGYGEYCPIDIRKVNWLYYRKRCN